MIKIAITGAKGFIGSHLIEALGAQRFPVKAIEGDIRSAGTWEAEFDLLYHLAACSPREFADSSGEAFSVNVDGTRQALEACRRNKARMVFASTCAVYKPDAMTVFSEDSPLAPLTAYGRSKLAGEELCRKYADCYGVKSTVFRLFSVYGPGQDPRAIVPYLMQSILKNYTAEVLHPDSSRDFIYVRDAVEAFLKLIVSKASFSVFNVGTGEANTIKGLIEIVSQNMGKAVTYDCPENSRDLQQSVCADIGRIKKDLGWLPKVGLREGIKMMADNISYERTYEKIS